MFNITEDIEKKWIDYSDDESYLITYINPERYQKFTDKKGNLKDIDKLIDLIITDWKGIFKAKDEPLKCTKEYKTLLFDKSPDRWAFVLTKALDYSTFFDIKKYSKN